MRTFVRPHGYSLTRCHRLRPIFGAGRDNSTIKAAGSLLTRSAIVGSRSFTWQLAPQTYFKCGSLVVAIRNLSIGYRYRLVARVPLRANPHGDTTRLRVWKGRRGPRGTCDATCSYAAGSAGQLHALRIGPLANRVCVPAGKSAKLPVISLRPAGSIPQTYFKCGYADAAEVSRSESFNAWL